MRRSGLSFVLFIHLFVAGSARAAPPTDEVSVRGEALAPPSRDRSVAGSVVREDRLSAPGLEAADVLRAEPGVQVSESGGAGAPAAASVRGATAAQTPVYLGGVRLNDDVGGAADLSLVPLWLVARVEVYRGNAPVEADRAGIGGAIFFEPVRPERAGRAAGGMLGSFGARSAWAYAGAGDGRSAAAIGARVDAATNDYAYVDDEGTRFEPQSARVLRRTNADVATYDVWALDTVKLADGGPRVDVLFNGVERVQGLPGLGLLPTRSARATTSRELGAVSARLPCDACTLTVTTSALLARSTIDDPLRELGLGAARTTTEGARVEQAVVTRFAPVARVSVHPALRAAFERLAVSSAAGDALHARRLTSSGGALVEWAATDRLTARAVAGVECDGTASSGFGEGGVCGDLTPSARAGAQWDPADGVTLLAGAGRYGRVPTLGERFGTSAAVRGNPALVPESGVTVDIGARVSWGTLALDVFAFARAAKDLVAYERSSAGYVLPYNVGSAAVRGVEALARWTPVALLDVDLAATALDARDTSAARTTVNDVLPFHSRLVLVPRATLKMGAVRALLVDAARVRVSYVYQSSRYADAAGLVVIPEQGSLDVEVEAELARRRLALRARLSDALDQTRFDLVGFPLPGRAAYAAMEVRW
jgi:iron complex outermembrane receptor protein